MVKENTSDPLVVLGRAAVRHDRPSEVARLGYLAGIIATILR